ncbi:MAG: hypothetical protein L0Y66_23365 [Myxococcaceae bacterium]|nr:hypothetical protein [Myxococcaceae bacterium]MCI0671408.1 hypothetical protein [Myxococcaceae bacterium]
MAQGMHDVRLMAYARGTRHISKLDDLLKRRGVIRAKELADVDLARACLPMAITLGRAQRLERGLYSHADDAPAQDLVACYRVPRGTLCVLSALHIHGVLARPPRSTWMALPRHAWRPRIREFPIEIVYVSERRWARDKELAHRSGRIVSVTSLARTLVDCFLLHHRLPPGAGAVLVRAALDAGRCTPEQLEAAARNDGVLKWMAPHLRRPNVTRPVELPQELEALLQPPPPPPRYKVLPPW